MNNSAFGRVAQKAKPALWLLILISLLVNVGMLIQPFFFMNMSFSVIMPRDGDALSFLIGILMFVFAMIFLFDMIRHRILNRIAMLFESSLAPDVHYSMINYTNKNPGAVLTQPMGFLEQIRMFISGGSAVGFLDLPFLPIYLIAIFVLEPLFFAYTLFAVSLVALLTVIDHIYTSKALKAYSEANAEASKQLNAHMLAAESVLVMGMKKRLYHRWLRSFFQALTHQNRQLTIYAKIANLSKMVRHLTPMGMMGVGAYISMNPSPTGEPVSVFVVMAASILMGRVIAIADMSISGWKMMIMAWSSFFGLKQLLDEHGPEENQKTMVLTQPIHQVQLEGVSFVSPRTGAVVIRGVSLLATKGQLWAIMGGSGSGKSTLARVILSIWQLTQGSLRVNDIELKTLDMTALGSYIGYLPQDIELLSGTIAQNISRFHLNPNLDMIQEAAMLAGVDRWIHQLPNGYDTMVGFEEGHIVSGGQRQQIALARAYFGRPSLLVLDEPNANLDEQGEVRLNQALAFFRSIGSIVFIVSHRTKVLEIADQLLILNRGVVSYSGSPKDIEAQA